MKNNRGFTLVEIISVIVLLGLIIGITVPSVMIASTNVKKKTLQTKIDNIEQAAVLYGQHPDYKSNISLYIDGKDAFGNMLTGIALENYKKQYKYCYNGDTLLHDCYYYNNGSSTTITIDDLIQAKLIKGDDELGANIINSLSEENMKDCEIQIYKKYGKIYAVYLARDTEDDVCWYEG